jgi:hypothetical protein
MSIDQRNVIDFIGTRNADGRCTLTISDHLPWDDPEHILKLQDKLNDYLAYIESGEIYKARPDAKGREIEIEVVCKYFPPQGDGVRFIELAGEAVRAEGLHFSVTTLQESPTKAKQWWQFWK